MKESSRIPIETKIDTGIILWADYLICVVGGRAPITG